MRYNKTRRDAMRRKKRTSIGRSKQARNKNRHAKRQRGKYRGQG